MSITGAVMIIYGCSQATRAISKDWLGTSISRKPSSESTPPGTVLVRAVPETLLGKVETSGRIVQYICLCFGYPIAKTGKYW